MITWLLGGAAALIGGWWYLQRKDGADSAGGSGGADRPASGLDPRVYMPSVDNGPGAQNVNFLPPQPTPNRTDGNVSMDQNEILDAVRTGRCEFSWVPIWSEFNGHRAEFRVMADALKVGSVRVPVSAITQQRIADYLDASPLTTKLSDLIWAQKTSTVLPQPVGVPDPKQLLAQTLAHSSKIDKLLGAKPWGLVSNVGKLWVLDNRLATAAKGTAVNYGWYGGPLANDVPASRFTLDGKPVKMIQSAGTHHNDVYVDYSQVCVLANNQCIVDGQPMTLQDVWSNPELAGLANVDGVLKVQRQPGVPRAEV